MQGDRKRAISIWPSLHLWKMLEFQTTQEMTPSALGEFGSPYEHEMAKWNPKNLILPELKKEGLNR